MTDVNARFVDELVEIGIERREARWLVEEFVPGSDDRAREALMVAARRRLDGEPLQYILGHWPFRTLDLDVDERALIPRPETEELVDVALRELATGASVAPLIVDLGTGTGAIGLSLVSELRSRGILATLIAVDESSEALALARQNARKHRLDAVSFVQSSWFESLDPSLKGRVDLVVANPPYVDEAAFSTLDPVLHYEPRGALVADSAHGVGGFADLDMIIAEAREWLAPGGVLVSEHGDTQGEAVLDAARAAGYREVRDLEDMAGRPRVLVASR
ncbi:MAG TPA: peptide chain release factor N(5)-glutamine methyltransferase [Acidimicrobiales bacterium]|nr:peptide chain release factor N(5)-glutamine methyltransferase [Acidimicrobiales bacterium]